jgi:hypothetical protein
MISSREEGELLWTGVKIGEASGDGDTDDTALNGIEAGLSNLADDEVAEVSEADLGVPALHAGLEATDGLADTGTGPV